MSECYNRAPGRGKPAPPAILRGPETPLTSSQNVPPSPPQGHAVPARTPIVVAYDASPDARRAAAWAGALAVSGAPVSVHLVRALGLPAIPHGPAGTTVDELLERHEATALAELATERDRLAAGGVAVETYLRRWLPVETTLERAAEVGAGLIVVGQHGNGPARLLLGSVSSAIVRAADCPVVVVRGRDGASPPRRVLLAFDASAGSLAAASAVARWLPRASVAALHVRAGDVPADEPALRAALVGAGLDASGVELRVEEGKAAQALLEAAESGGYDLVAAGRRGRSAWRDLVLGSVADKLVQLASCPVLVAH